MLKQRSTFAAPKLSVFRGLPENQWPLSPSGKITKDAAREAIRQWSIKKLIETYNYPAEWLGTRIVLTDSNDGLYGYRVLTADGVPFIWVSIAQPGESEQAERLLRAALLENVNTGLGLVTDGTQEGTHFLRRRFDNAKCEYITDFESCAPAGLFSRQLVSLPAGEDAAQSHTLVPLSERLENVFFEVHSHIRDIDGFHADEALDEVCKILYAKMYDEENTPSNRPYRAQRWMYGTTEEFAASIRNLYHEAADYDSRVFSLKIPGYQRSRGVFGTPFRLSSPALTRAMETLQEYTLTGSATDVKGRAFQKVLGPALRAGMGQYFTPEPVIRFIVRVVSPSITELILDPFCGSAHFLTTCLQHVRAKTPDSSSSKSFHEFSFGKLHGIEKSDRMVRVAMTGMRLHGDGHSNIRCTDALLAFENYRDIHPESFDLILTNPPFGSLLGPDALSQLGRFNLAEGKKNVPLEVLGLERCIQFLRPGGRLAIVLPDGLLANRNSRYVRDWLEKEAKLTAVVSLPVETFSPFGANVKTSIVFVRKWRKGEHRESKYPVFIARADNVGYDASGRDREGCDLETAASDMLAFLAKEGW